MKIIFSRLVLTVSMFSSKPSSSGRAAELMSRSGSTGFVGFGDVGSTSDGSSLQFVPAGNDSDVLVHADFHVVMKKLTKRDALTRLKVKCLCLCI